MTSVPQFETVFIRHEKYAVSTCGDCGVVYTVPLMKYETMWRLGGYAFCPNGHERGWREGHEEQDRLRNERDRAIQKQAQLADELREALQKTEAAQKKYLQSRRRAAAGVCPCCNRTFTNVQRHMATKHKNIVPLSQKAAT